MFDVKITVKDTCGPFEDDKEALCITQPIIDGPNILKLRDYLLTDNLDTEGLEMIRLTNDNTTMYLNKYVKKKLLYKI